MFYRLLPDISLNNIAITAITSSTCMIDPRLNAKNPIAQKITNITAIV